MRFLILLLLIPSLALALDVTIQIDGEQSRAIEAESAAMAITDGRIIIDVSTDNDEPEPEPEPEPNECGAVPRGVTVDATLNWEQPGGQRRETLTGAEIRAYRIDTTASRTYSGQISTGYTPNNPSTRHVWVSRCPAGEPLAARCESHGYETAIVRWSQGEPQRWECAIPRNDRLYINVQHRTQSGALSCTGRCDYFLIVYGSQ